MNIEYFDLKKKRKKHFFKQFDIDYNPDYGLSVDIPLKILKNDISDKNIIDVLCFYMKFFPKDTEEPIVRWGYHQSWYDGPIHFFALGNFLRFSWTTQPVFENEQLYKGSK